LVEVRMNKKRENEEAMSIEFLVSHLEEGTIHQYFDGTNVERGLEDYTLPNSQADIGNKPAAKLASQWNCRFEELKEFRKRFGHCNVPRGGDCKVLGDWVNAQRFKKRKDKLSLSRIDALESLGFQWNLRTKESDKVNLTWEESFNKLVEFKKEYGHYSVSKKIDSQLGYWVNNQRACKKEGRISEERFKKLESIGFDWNPGCGGNVGIPWEESFEKLRRFKEEFGDCNVS